MVASSGQKKSTMIDAIRRRSTLGRDTLNDICSTTEDERPTLLNNFTSAGFLKEAVHGKGCLVLGAEMNPLITESLEKGSPTMSLLCKGYDGEGEVSLNATAKTECVVEVALLCGWQLGAACALDQASLQRLTVSVGATQGRHFCASSRFETISSRRRRWANSQPT